MHFFRGYVRISCFSNGVKPCLRNLAVISFFGVSRSVLCSDAILENLNDSMTAFEDSNCPELR
jgi:hypothetical protein